jgi:chromosome segregation ATPase
MAAYTSEVASDSRLAEESDVLVDEELPPDTEKHNELMQGLSDRQDAADRQCESYDDLCVKTEEDLAKWSDYIKLVVEVREKESELAALQKEDDDLTANIDTMMCEKEKREAEMERVNALLAQRTEEVSDLSVGVKRCWCGGRAD